MEDTEKDFLKVNSPTQLLELAEAEIRNTLLGDDANVENLQNVSSQAIVNLLEACILKYQSTFPQCFHSSSFSANQSSINDLNYTNIWVDISIPGMKSILESSDSARNSLSEYAYTLALLGGSTQWIDCLRASRKMFHELRLTSSSKEEDFLYSLKMIHSSILLLNVLVEGEEEMEASSPELCNSNSQDADVQLPEDASGLLQEVEQQLSTALEVIQSNLHFPFFVSSKEPEQPGGSKIATFTTILLNSLQSVHDICTLLEEDDMDGVETHTEGYQRILSKLLQICHWFLEHSVSRTTVSLGEQFIWSWTLFRISKRFSHGCCPTGIKECLQWSVKQLGGFNSETLPEEDMMSLLNLLGQSFLMLSFVEGGENDENALSCYTKATQILHLVSQLDPENEELRNQLKLLEE